MSGVVAREEAGVSFFSSCVCEPQRASTGGACWSSWDHHGGLFGVGRSAAPALVRARGFSKRDESCTRVVGEAGCVGGLGEPAAAAQPL